VCACEDHIPIIRLKLFSYGRFICCVIYILFTFSNFQLKTIYQNMTNQSCKALAKPSTTLKVFVLYFRPVRSHGARLLTWGGGLFAYYCVYVRQICFLIHPAFIQPLQAAARSICKRVAHQEGTYSKGTSFYKRICCVVLSLRGGRLIYFPHLPSEGHGNNTQTSFITASPQAIDRPGHRSWGSIVNDSGLNFAARLIASLSRNLKTDCVLFWIAMSTQ
jgi:hypothetical protein